MNKNEYELKKLKWKKLDLKQMLVQINSDDKISLFNPRKAIFITLYSTESGKKILENSKLFIQEQLVQIDKEILKLERDI